MQLSRIEAELVCHLFFDGPVWDGNLISKVGRDSLVDRGFVERAAGFQWLTLAGILQAKRMGFTDRKTGRHPRAAEVWRAYAYA